MNKLSDLSAPPLQPLLKPSRWTRAVYAALWVVGTVWLVMILAWSTLNMFIVPRIGDYRELLQTQASRAMGMPVLTDFHEPGQANRRAAVVAKHEERRTEGNEEPAESEAKDFSSLCFLPYLL